VILTSLAAGLLGLSGCATTPWSMPQEIGVEVVSATGAPAPDARCTLRQGSVETIVAPARRVTLTTSAEDLVVRCQSDTARGESRVPAAAQGSRTRSALIGAAVGALLGGAAGSSSSDGQDYVGSETWRGVGAIVGLVVGAGIGALAGTPTYEYPARVRVVLEPASPATPKP
jgi:hypothetical protein